MQLTSRLIITASLIATAYLSVLQAQDMTICTKEFAPVCGSKQVQCVTTPCDPINVTYENRCQLNADKATFVSTGQCVDTPDMTPWSQVVLPSKLSDTVRSAINRAFKSVMDNSTRLTADWIKLAENVIKRIDDQLNTIKNELMVSIYTPEWSKRVLTKAAMLQLIKDTIQSLINESINSTTNSCQSYFDGCNVCNLMENGERACTKKYCDATTMTTPYCMDR